jgi:hypothetical protein
MASNAPASAIQENGATKPLFLKTLPVSPMNRRFCAGQMPKTPENGT